MTIGSLAAFIYKTYPIKYAYNLVVLCFAVVITWDVNLDLYDAFNCADAEIGIFQKNEVNTMAADALAPCVARTSTAMVLTSSNKCILVIYKREEQRWIIVNWTQVINFSEI